MLFRKQLDGRPSAERRRSASADVDGVVPKFLSVVGGADDGQLAMSASNGADAAAALGMVLDALGGVLSALARFPLELPQRPAEESAQELSAWHRHATMGLPVEPTPDAKAVGLPDRDWNGVVRAVTQQRRDEHQYVETAIAELREALWACVETVHKAVRVDNSSDAQAESQMERARKAITRLQTGSIKQEVLGAVNAIQSALESRREHHREQYASLATKLEKLGRQLEEAKKESTTDPLTGVGNRKLFDMMAPRATQLYSLSKAPVTLIMIDLDKLKMVNDMYGHQAGDAFIAGVAKCLSKVFLRQSDVVCRYGGDEFAVILHNTDAKGAQSLGVRLMEHIGEMAAPHAAMEFQVGASAGIAELQDGEEVEQWVARADRALYKAKQLGNVRVVAG